MDVIKCEPDPDSETLPMSSANKNQQIDVKREEHPVLPSVNWEAEVSCSSDCLFFVIIILHIANL
jgi:hypothetical protein